MSLDRRGCKAQLDWLMEAYNPEVVITAELVLWRELSSGCVLDISFFFFFKQARSKSGTKMKVV